MKNNTLIQRFYALPRKIRFLIMLGFIVISVMAAMHHTWIDAIIHLLQSFPVIIVLPRRSETFQKPDDAFSSLQDTLPPESQKR